MNALRTKERALKTALLLVWTVFAVVPQAIPQSQIGDFTRSPYEHIINEIDQPFVVRSVVGFITMLRGDERPISGVLFEIQGPGTARKIRRCKTDERGKFKIGHVPEGTYRFKATLSGSQSVMGNIIVSKKAGKNKEIKIAMPVGV
jgi:hypothetical protein